MLAHHWPDVANLGDMTKLPGMIRRGEIEAPDLLVGGTPCQAFSVAGLRQSLDDERGNLTLRFVELADAINEQKPYASVVWENVPGVLNTRDNAFGCFLGALCGEDEPLRPAGKRWTNAGIVHGPKRRVAWRVLDAQYFGVAQRRRRVFVVASPTNRRGGIYDPGQVLFERESVRRDTATCRKEEQDAAAFIEAGFGGYSKSPVACTLRAQSGAVGGGSETLVVHGTQDPCVSDKAFTLGRNNGGENVVCIAGNIIGREPHNGGNGNGYSDEGVSYTLTASDQHAVCHGATVRRLTPIECERLQGFPDNHTQIPWRGKLAEDCPDGPRYKAIGNSMAVPVMRWIGERIQAAVFPFF